MLLKVSKEPQNFKAGISSMRDFKASGGNYYAADFSNRADTFSQTPEQDTSRRKKIALYSILSVLGLAVLAAISHSRVFRGQGYTWAKDTVQKTKEAGVHFNILPNFSNVKDSFLKWVYNCKIPGFGLLRKLDEKSTNFYKQTGFKVADYTYKKAARLFGDVDAKILSLLENTPDIPPSEFKNIKKLLSQRHGNFENYFGAAARKTRFAEMENLMENLDSKVRKTFKDALKNKQYSRISKEFLSRNILSADKAVFQNKLQEGHKIAANDSELKNALIKLLSKERFEAEINPMLTKSKKALDKAVNLEGGDLFDKLRDIKCGCAPSDFIDVGAAAGLMGLYMAQAKSKEERNSVALTTGIPVTVGILSRTIATAGLISGFGALGLGLASGLIAGIIGKKIDKAYKEKYNVNDKEFILPSFSALEDVEKLPEYLRTL